jgi:hypothetical protein
MLATRAKAMRMMVAAQACKPAQDVLFLLAVDLPIGHLLVQLWLHGAGIADWTLERSTP